MTDNEGRLLAFRAMSSNHSTKYLISPAQAPGLSRALAAPWIHGILTKGNWKFRDNVYGNTIM